MLDAPLEWLEWVFIALLVIPVIFALGMGIMKWWGEGAESHPGSSGQTEEAAEVKALGFVQDGQIHRLRLANAGSIPAHDVHVYVNNKPIPAHRGRASAEQHPIPKLEPRRTVSYRYASGRPDGDGGVIVRIEWQDATGENIWESVVEVP